MSGTPLTEALSAIPLVVAHSHYGLLWAMGTVAGALALIVAQRPIARTTGNTPVVVALAIAGFAHAATTHAADARDFSVAEIVHTAHLIATAGWAGAVITAAWPLRQAFSASPSDVSAHTVNLSNIATLMFLVAIATGIYDAHRGLGGSLWSVSAKLWGIMGYGLQKVPRVSRRSGFGYHIDEGATTEVFLAEPLTQGFSEDGQRSSLIKTSLHLFDKPTHPELMSTVQQRRNEFVLGGEMPVKRHFCNARLCNDLVDSRSTEPVLTEQASRSFQDPVACRRL
jgi:hypothetical protein